MKQKSYQHIFMIEDREIEDGKKKSFWTKVGVAFENRDGSWSIDLRAMPVSGKLHMRYPQTTVEAAA
jgi:hypothetical protein